MRKTIKPSIINMNEKTLTLNCRPSKTVDEAGTKYSYLLQSMKNICLHGYYL